MLAALCLVLLIIMFASRRIKGPLWALAIAWLISLVPVAAQVVHFSYLSPWDVEYPLLLGSFLAMFVLGAALETLRKKNRRIHRGGRPTQANLAQALPWARVAWLAGITGTACLIIDFTLLQGAGLDDLAALRDTYIARDTTAYAKLASILTWGCLFCFAFSLSFKDLLNRRQFAFFILPIVGYFFVALFSAGRQTALQIALFTVLTLGLNSARSGRNSSTRTRGGLLLPLSITLSMVAYMAYVAVARNDDLISDDKAEVLMRLFDCATSPIFDTVTMALGPSVRSSIVEGMIYFSSPVALFSRFLEIDPKAHTFGAMSLPFVMRQLEPLTGINVAGALENKIWMMRDAGVIGAGWTTGISSYVLDFGIVGGLLILLAQGFYSAYTWRRAIGGCNFDDAVISLVMLTAAIYTPLIPASAETNLLLLWLFCVVSRSWRMRRRKLTSCSRLLPSRGARAVRKSTPLNPIQPL